MDWLSIEDAVDYLSSGLDRQITARHVFDFALRNELVLSCRLMGEYACRRVSYLPFDSAEAKVTLSKVPKDLIPPKKLPNYVIGENEIPKTVAGAIRKDLNGAAVTAQEANEVNSFVESIWPKIPDLFDLYREDEISNLPREFKALISDYPTLIKNKVPYMGFEGFRVFKNEKHILQYNDRSAIKFASGLWDISLLGNFKFLLERHRQNLIGYGGEYCLVDPPTGYILKDIETGELIQLAKYKEIKGVFKDKYEVGVLDDLSLDGIELVVRLNELNYYLDTQTSAASDNLKTKNADKKVKRSESPREWHESLEEIFKELIDSLGLHPSYKHVKEFIRKLEHESDDYAFTGTITKNRSTKKSDVFHLHGAQATVSQSSIERKLTDLKNNYKKES